MELSLDRTQLLRSEHYFGGYYATVVFEKHFERHAGLRRRAVFHVASPRGKPAECCAERLAQRCRRVVHGTGLTLDAHGHLRHEDHRRHVEDIRGGRLLAAPRATAGGVRRAVVY